MGSIVSPGGGRVQEQDLGASLRVLWLGVLAESPELEKKNLWQEKGIDTPRLPEQANEDVCFGGCPPVNGFLHRPHS